MGSHWDFDCNIPGFQEKEAGSRINPGKIYWNSDWNPTRLRRDSRLRNSIPLRIYWDPAWILFHPVQNMPGTRLGNAKILHFLRKYTNI
jgi:hypothetical protein